MKSRTVISKLMAIVAMLALTSISYAEAKETAGGIPLDNAWKASVYEFAKENLQHSAWGVAHFERNYLLATEIAKHEGVTIDSDVLFAASFLHDIGVFKPYVIEGEEHSKTAADNVEKILSPTGFPMSKLSQVKAAIMSHMFYAPVGEDATARVLHDADVLDFLGAIGVARILSVSEREEFAPSINVAAGTIKKFNSDLPATLVYDWSKKLAEQRTAQTVKFVEALDAATLSGKTL